MRVAVWALAAASTLGLTPQLGRVEAQELRTWPAPHETLWGGWQASCNLTQQSKEIARDAGAKIAPALCPVIKQLEKPLVQNFSQQLQIKLHAKVSLSEGLSPAVRVSDALKDTLIASLHLSRADIWLVPKRNTQEIVIPYTITLNLTNAASGEVAYTVSKSVALQGLFPLGEVGISEASAQLGDSLSTAVTALVDEAAAHFKPYAIAATVKEKTSDGYYILDKGRLDGMRRGDRIGFAGEVIFSDANYSVFSDGFSKIEVGQQISKSATAPLDVLSRPTVFVVFAQQPEKMSADYLKIQFEQQLGQGKALTVMPSNRSFSNIRELMLQEARAPSEGLTARPTPDYLLRVRVYALPSTHFDTNLPGTKVYSYEAHALAELTDSSGRIVYATSVKNHIDDQVSAEISFSDDARQDTVVKNALIQLADKISAEFKPQAFRLAISGSGGSAVISDPSGSISQGATGLVLHKRGKIGGVTGDVWVPLGEFQLIPTAEGRLGLAGDGFSKSKPGNGDVFAFDSGSTNNLSSISYSGCSDNLPLVDMSASSHPEVLFALAENQFAANFAAPVYIHGFGKLLASAMEDFDKNLLSKMGALSRGDTDRCFRPVVRITRGEDATTRGGGVAPTVKVISGFTLHAGTTSAAEKLLGGGRQNEMTGSEVPLNAQPNEREVSLVRDIASLVSDQTTQWLKSSQPPK